MGRRSLSSMDDYSRALKDGRGIGVGTDYLPWLRVNDVSSHGKSTKIQGIKVERTHQLLSGIELNFFLYAEFNPRVIDIREQFPLFPLDLVVRVAAEAGIQYPINANSKTPSVLSTDFLLTLKDEDHISYLAVAVKPEEALQEEKVLERLEIERVWWETLGIPWRLVTEKQLNRQVAENIDWISDPLRGRKRLALGDDMEQILGRLVAQMETGIYEWLGLVDRLAVGIGQDSKLTSSLLRAALWLRHVTVNLDTPIQKQGLIEILSVSSDWTENEKNGAVNS
ncbi:MAG: Tn7 transposase TnsA N-terminal domain-containing protein [Gammaproteobacteria bacterium]|nr:Tn7 transposase TnsA N-terminal domain-containing protein [Gammaproteobacteria bacterium]